MPRPDSIQRQFGEKPILPIAALAAMGGLVFLAGLSFGMTWLSLAVVLACFGWILVAGNARIPLVLIALIPFSQALPIKSGFTTIGIVPEYFIIPLCAAFAVLHRIERADFRIDRTGFVMPALAFLMASAMSLLWASGMFGIGRMIPAIGTLFVFTLAFIAFLLILGVIRDRETSVKVMLLLFAGSCVMSVYGIIDYLLNIGGGDFARRTSSLFGQVFWKEGGGNPNVFGAYLMCIAVMALELRRNFTGRQRLLVQVSFFLSLITLVLTFSRSSLIGFLVAAAIIAVRKDRRLLLWAIPLLGSAAFFLLQVPRIAERLKSAVEVVTNPAIIRFFSTVDLKSVNWEYIGVFGLAGYSIDVAAGAGRIGTWIQGARLFLDHPLLGVGLRMGAFYTGGFETAENIVLDVASMTGIFGLLAAFWLVGRVLRVTRKARKVTTWSFAKDFGDGFSAMTVGLLILSMTGSVLFSLKLLLFLAVLVAVLWRVTEESS